MEHLSRQVPWAPRGSNDRASQRTTLESIRTIVEEFFAEKRRFEEWVGYKVTPHISFFAAGGERWYLILVGFGDKPIPVDSGAPVWRRDGDSYYIPEAEAMFFRFLLGMEELKPSFTRAVSLDYYGRAKDYAQVRVDLCSKSDAEELEGYL